jgi:alkylated DNA repair dioxygenase AlkB
MSDVEATIVARRDASPEHLSIERGTVAARVIRTDLGDGAFLLFDPTWLPSGRADAIFAHLQTTIPWKQEANVEGERVIPHPRLTAWFGDRPYTYSGVTVQPNAWTPELLAVRAEVEAATGERFDSLLANLYRSGDDSVGFHADAEPELGPEPVIASVSLGATRRFVMRRRRGRAPEVALDLGHGSLLVMGGTTQQRWRHGVPRQPGAGPRINLTFRRLIAPG